MTAGTAEKLRTYISKRSDEKKRVNVQMAKLGWAAMFFGCSMFLTVLLAGRWVELSSISSNGGREAMVIVRQVGFVAMVCGLGVLALASNLDFNLLFAEHFWFSLIACEIGILILVPVVFGMVAPNYADTYFLGYIPGCAFALPTIFVIHWTRQDVINNYGNGNAKLIPVHTTDMIVLWMASWTIFGHAGLAFSSALRCNEDYHPRADLQSTPKIHFMFGCITPADNSTDADPAAIARWDAGYAAAAVIVAVSLACVAYTVAKMRRRRRRQQSRNGNGNEDEYNELPDSVLMWRSILWMLFSIGVAFLIAGVFPAPGVLALQRAELLAAGSSISVLIGVVLAFKNTLLGYIARKFEHENAIEDGVFIASLLQRGAPKVGSTWWLHDDYAYTSTPQRKKRWYKGTVINVDFGRQNFSVKVDNPATLPANSTIAEAAAAAAAAAAASANAGVAVSQARTAPFDPFNRIMLIDGVYVPNASVIVATVASHPVSDPTALVKIGTSSLRCIDFTSVTKDLIVRSPRESPVSTHHGQDVDDGFHAKSRKCKPGEIDWFISHSWNDNPHEKWKMLKAAAERFYDAEGRWPVLWLDKVCLNQRNIELSLKLLPIYVLASKQVLVLAGDSYITRIWCIWEIYTLFAVSDGKPKIQIEAFSNNEPDHVECEPALMILKTRLENFEISNCNCYDPNEESKILAAVSASPGGAASFNNTVRALSLLLGTPEVEGAQRGLPTRHHTTPPASEPAITAARNTGTPSPPSHRSHPADNTRGAGELPPLRVPI